MHVLDLDVLFGQILRQTLRHLLGQSGDEHASALFGLNVDLRQQVVDLPLDGTYRHLGIEQARRAYQLLDDLPRLFEFVRSGRRRHADHLPHSRVKFLKPERTVVVRRRQTEPVIDKIDLARKVAVVHRPQLRQRHVALVDEQNKVLWEKVEQRVRRLTGAAPVKIARIVLDAAAIAHLADHLDVVAHSLSEPLRLEQLALRLKLLDALDHVLSDLIERLVLFLLFDDIVARRKEIDVFELADRLCGQRIELHDALDLIAPKFHPHRDLGTVDREHLDHVASHAETRALELYVAALVLYLYQPVDELLSVHRHAGTQRHRERIVFERRAETVNARHGRDDDDIARFAERACRRVAQLVYLVVDRQVLFDVGIGAGDVRLGLIVIVIGNEIFDPVVGEKLAELIAQLRGERLVVRNDQRRAVEPRDDVRHRERLAAAGHAQEHLRAQPVLDTLDELLYRLRLIAAGLEFAVKFVHLSRRLST